MIRLELRSMRSLVAVALTVAAVLPASVLLLIGLISDHHQRQARLDAALIEQAALIDTTLATTLAGHLAVLRSLAALPELERDFRDPEIRPWLRVLRGEHLAFSSALAARADGRVLAVQPHLNPLEPTEFWLGLSVADRDYLQRPLATGESYVSLGLRDRAAGSSPIIALSTPVYAEGRPLGILKGAIPLDTLTALLSAPFGRDPAIALLLLDRGGAVLVADPVYGLRPLEASSEYPALAEPGQHRDWSSPIHGAQRSYTMQTLDGGRLVVSGARTPLQYALAQDLLRAAVVVAALLGLALLVARPAARLITAPLHQLVSLMRGAKVAEPASESGIRIRELVDAEQAFRELEHAHAESTAQLQATLRRQTELYQRLEDTVRNQEAAIQARTAELRQALAALKDESLTDSLTGLSNYRHYWRSLPKVWEQAAQGRQPLNVIALDIDHFKRFNDTYGHQAGDQCLRRVAAALRLVFAERAELVARTGGEEFIIVLRGITPHAARNLAERARHAVQALNIPHAGNPGPGVVTISLGLCSCEPDPNGSIDELVQRADALLYASKAAGRNRTTSEELRWH